MGPSVWTGTLAELREKAGGTDPLPAGVTISAITASLVLALLAKVLDINGKRKGFTGDQERLGALLDSARRESVRLTQLADDDIRAFNHYLECRREDRDVNEAMRKAIEVPMNAARAAVRGLVLCEEAIAVVHGQTAADLGMAAALLHGAARAVLLSVDFNVLEMHSDKEYSAAITAERRQLELEALRRDGAITAAIKTLSAL